MNLFFLEKATFKQCSNMLFTGIKLFSFIAEKWLKDDKIEEVKSLAKYLEEDVLKDFVASSDLEVQERASVLHHFVKYVAKHLEKGRDIYFPLFEVLHYYFFLELQFESYRVLFYVKTFVNLLVLGYLLAL